MSNLADITVAILAGGLGTRLRSKVFDRPKVLAEVGNNPFLQRLLEQLNLAGFKKVVLCTGYLGGQIKEKLGKKYKKIVFSYSQEQSPLGTGGALRLALPLLESETVLVMNGDSFCDIDFKGFLRFHLNKKADASLAVLYMPETDRFGKVSLGLDDKILGFEEKKKGSGQGFINAGIYLLKRSLLSEIPESINISLEKEIFPRWVKRNLYGYKGKGRFIDIGTPQSYAQAAQFFTNIKRRFVLLDRDGTIIVERNYLANPGRIELLPKVVEALRKFKEMSLGLVVITNQAGVGRGYFSLNDLRKIHKRMISLLAEEGVTLDGIYFCPHVPEDNCNCRKPRLGLIEKALKEHNFNPSDSFVIGDKALDVELGKAMGATTFLVRTGYGAEVEKERIVQPDYIVNDLLEVTNIIQQRKM